MKTITISDELAKNILEFCRLELDYQIEESSEPEGWHFEVKTELALLKLISEGELAESYRADYIKCLEELEAEYPSEEIENALTNVTAWMPLPEPYDEAD